MGKAFQGPIELNGKRYEVQGVVTKQRLDEWGEAAPQTTQQTPETRRFVQTWHVDTIKGLLCDRDYDASESKAYYGTLETRFAGQITLGPLWTSCGSAWTGIVSGSDIVGGVRFGNYSWIAEAQSTSILARYFNTTNKNWASTTTIQAGMTAPKVHDLAVHGAYLFAVVSDGTSCNIARFYMGGSWSFPLNPDPGNFPRTLDNANDKLRLCSCGNTLFLFRMSYTTLNISVYYSLDNGVTWTAASTSTSYSTINIGKAVAYVNADGDTVPYLSIDYGILRYSTTGTNPEMVYRHGYATPAEIAYWPAAGMLFISGTLGSVTSYKVSSDGDILTSVGLDLGAPLPEGLANTVSSFFPTERWLLALFTGSGAYYQDSVLMALDTDGNWHNVYASTTADAAFPAGAIPEDALVVEENDFLHVVYKASATSANGVFAHYGLDNPLAHSDYDYATTGYIDLPRYAGALPELTAAWLQCRVDADDLSASTAGEYISVYYGEDGEARTTTDLGDFLSGTTNLLFASGVGVESRTIAPRLIFTRDASTTTHSPKLYGFSVEYVKVPMTRHVFQCTVDVARTAILQSRTEEEVYNDLEDLEDTVTQVTFSAPGVASCLVKALAPTPGFRWVFEQLGPTNPLEVHTGVGFVQLTLLELVDTGSAVISSSVATSHYLRHADVQNTPDAAKTDYPISAAWAANVELTLNPDTLFHADVDDVPVDSATDVPISSNWAYDHKDAETGVHGAGAGTLLATGDVEDTPQSGHTTNPISSGHMYTHEADKTAHNALVWALVFGG